MFNGISANTNHRVYTKKNDFAKSGSREYGEPLQDDYFGAVGWKNYISARTLKKFDFDVDKIKLPKDFILRKFENGSCEISMKIPLFDVNATDSYRMKDILYPLLAPGYDTCFFETDLNDRYTRGYDYLRTMWDLMPIWESEIAFWKDEKIERWYNLSNLFMVACKPEECMNEQNLEKFMKGRFSNKNK